MYCTYAVSSTLHFLSLSLSLTTPLSMTNETAYGEIDENISIVQSNKKLMTSSEKFHMLSIEQLI